MYAKRFKRMFDVIFASLILVLISPIMIIITILLSIVYKGSPFFIQERPGLDNNIFYLLKFKTMTDEMNIYGKHLPDEERITMFGRILRKLSLDELPQLINVLRGEMSIIGPRPLLSKYVPYYTIEESLRSTVRPGITGLAQIEGRNNLGWDRRLALDIEYINNISLLGDIKILVATLWAVLRSKNVSVLPTTKMRDLDEERMHQRDKIHGN